MRILKKLFIALAAIVALILVIAAFLPSRNKLERSIEINKPVSDVYKEVADFNKWRAWNPWSEMDPESKVTVAGTPGQVGSTWAWKGDKTGSGIMNLDSLTENSYLKTTLKFKEPMEGNAVCFWKFEPTTNGTKATWSYDGEANYPMGRIFGLFMDKMLGAHFEKGLQNLKKVSESK